MREIETIRETLIQFLDLTGATTGTKHSRAIKALSTLEARIAELEACALDLTKVPSGWQLRDCGTRHAGGFYCALRSLEASPESPDYDRVGYGPTPRAALESAMGRIKG